MRARVVTGHGIAAGFVVTALPFTPVPGTLNCVALEQHEFPSEYDGIIAPWYRGPIPFRLGSVGAYPVAALGVLSIVLPGYTVEILAPVHLRSALNLQDGDVIDIVI